MIDSNTIYVFDKGYNDYKAFEMFSLAQAGFVTRIKDNTSYETLAETAIKIQIYCALIANLLMALVQKMLKRQWAFSNLISSC